MYNNIISYLTNTYREVFCITYFGSHQFDLNSPSSDIDLIAMVGRPISHYLKVTDVDLSIPTKKIDGIDLQVLDINHALYLASKSNFQILSILLNIFNHKELYNVESNPLLELDLGRFNLNRLAHHVLGMITSNHQKVYMRAYNNLLLDYIFTYNEAPSKLEYWWLLEKIKKTNRTIIIENILNDKRINGLKDFADIDISSFMTTITHEDINLNIPNENDDYMRDMCNFLWYNYVKERL